MGQRCPPAWKTSDVQAGAAHVRGGGSFTQEAEKPHEPGPVSLAERGLHPVNGAVGAGAAAYRVGPLEPPRDGTARPEDMSLLDS